ncbi:MAG: hypothetical protein HYT14_00865 [Candidatus Liptonbacteria bacterium]|nr:hypothetical protein [Candidatus Liptonbacteria bacterium]
MENKNKKVWVWVVIGALVVAGLWWYAYYQPTYQAPGELPQTAQPLSGGDTTADITDDLNAIDLGDIDKDLQQLDADIEQL